MEKKEDVTERQYIVRTEHLAQYYETDQMGIIHHSNYIRWFEEARIHMMDVMGIGYKVMESHGIESPVISVECDYKSMTHFNDTVVIETKIIDYNGIKMKVGYTVTDKESGKVRATGETGHCFLNMEGKPVSLKKAYADLHELILTWVVF